MAAAAFAGSSESACNRAGALQQRKQQQLAKINCGAAAASIERKWRSAAGLCLVITWRQPAWHHGGNSSGHRRENLAASQPHRINNIIHQRITKWHRRNWPNISENGWQSGIAPANYRRSSLTPAYLSVKSASETI